MFKKVNSGSSSSSNDDLKFLTSLFEAIHRTNTIYY